MLLYALRASGVVCLVLAPLAMKVVGSPSLGMILMCYGFGILMPDVVEGMNDFRGGDKKDDEDWY
jgi:hypothetical protein